ncbi:MarR family winged helix-turn-helix transcriptional regulator [Heyndrickxia ginsengihumi]|uniref:MarR family transcriptional regulator n=1 Tax=Heyndrickxia ginsengihumi TaxID=363870 RepID=A0A0A6VEE1_9BACI|nr:MarR family transcriptional regulator [Heyndrickxia ginsengihumi]KHD86640.1 hypothetical protein NG54_02140 [Heyndrickxia ginsengihumi]MBE6185198.1 MarR family transcriptional regulator [Bacillus sp. (in: firmicutes)]MCM3022682.1 MarR family transcriptional regulator [Heyndrickxia ginsengihumi]NEY18980.1 MarR family transcriptional regulator [Heyndrickxia ginsengihumi]
MINEWAEEYFNLSFNIHKNGKFLIQNELNELTYDQVNTLRYIYQKQSITSTELAQWLNVNKSAISALLNRLDEKELIKRDRSDQDRRIVHLSLTNKGTQLFEDCYQKINLLVQDLIGSFDEEELCQYMKTFKKIDQLLEGKIKQMKGVAK